MVKEVGGFVEKQRVVVVFRFNYHHLQLGDYNIPLPTADDGSVGAV